MDKKKNDLQNDFVFVQMDKKIHDIKFQTKPTTYFKDAFKRFRKNKSSVIAGLIIGFLGSLSVLVPILNTSNIDRPLFEARFLPPRWPGLEWIGVLDGTTVYNNVIIDQVTDPDNPVPVGFKSSAILGDVTIYDTFSNFPSPYATGGMLVLRSDTRSNDGFFLSPNVNLDITNNDFDIRTSLNELNDEVDLQASYRLIARVEYTPNEFTLVPLNAFSTNYGVIEARNISSTLLAAKPANVDPAIYRMRFGFQLQTTLEGDYPALYIDAFQMKRSVQNSYQDSLFSNVNFTSGNEVMLRDGIDNTLPNRWILETGSKSVFRAVLPRGNFRYDNYLAAFGDVLRDDIGRSVVEEYIRKGWMEYDFLVGPSSFKLLNEDKSPIREVLDQTTFAFGGAEATSLTAVVSIYRERGFPSIPYYLFGTDVNGNDYFKIIFSGLGTSLLLGILVALINVTIGMVWGALSGYYGGWIDITMERFTEILGGVPWIVLMTLTILLLGSNFGTFLLALTLTGWIGTASLTRSQFYRYKRREYVLASRTLGAKDGRLIFRHILPNSIGPIVTTSVLIIPGVIFSEAAISFLGLGLQGLPSLGVALSRAQGYLQTSPHLTISGAVIISLLLISFNLFGNGLRDAFNPSLKGISE
jgi:oligopeptide transport system permease protein